VRRAPCAQRAHIDGSSGYLPFLSRLAAFALGDTSFCLQFEAKFTRLDRLDGLARKQVCGRASFTPVGLAAVNYPLSPSPSPDHPISIKWAGGVRVVRTMIRLGKAVTLVSLLCATIFLGLIVALHHSRNHARRTTEVLTSLGVKKITFSNPVASGAFARVHASFVSFFSLRSEFYVDGTSIPEVNFDVGPSWSGLIPISGAANETRKVRDSKLGNDRRTRA
jgi:hypothetical protein